MAQREPHYVKGLAGLTKVFGCSETQAVHIKRSGLIYRAIKQAVRRGNSLVDADKSLELYDCGRGIITKRK